jgi:hypothetical protein
LRTIRLAVDAAGVILENAGRKQEEVEEVEVRERFA